MPMVGALGAQVLSGESRVSEAPMGEPGEASAGFYAAKPPRAGVSTSGTAPVPRIYTCGQKSAAHKRVKCEH
jgi:hypothetical protein